MKTFDIKLSKRKEVGKKSTKLLRKENLVPCVVYGGEEVLHVYAHKNEFRKIIYTPNVYLLNLDIDGTVYRTILQDVQFHPVSDEILHIDFFQISEDKNVIINLPVKLTGNSIGILAGGSLHKPKDYLKVTALPKDLPDNIEIDITKLEIGDSLKIRDLIIDNVEFLEKPNVMVVAVNITRVVEEEVEEEGEEGEEGAEKTDEKGDTPAKDDKKEFKK